MGARGTPLASVTEATAGARRHAARGARTGGRDTRPRVEELGALCPRPPVLADGTLRVPPPSPPRPSAFIRG